MWLFLILHQNSTKGSFLMVGCVVESQTISMNFSDSVTWKSISQPCIRMGLLPMHNLGAPSIGHLENIGWLSFVDLPTVETFHYTVSKTKNKYKIFNIATAFISKVLRLKTYKLVGAHTSFQDSNFHLKAEFYHL